MLRQVRAVLVTLALCSSAGCISIVAPYDPEFDQVLHSLSEETAKFLAAAESGGPERLASSEEAVTYYATTYNVLDRLSQRAKLKRGIVACPNDADLKTFSEQPTSSSPLPTDYAKFDCLEAHLYYVRFYVDQLDYAERSGGVLTRGEAVAAGGILQISILGAIQTFLVGKSG